MSYFTRLASTDEQEAAIAWVEKAAKKASVRLTGGTTIGKSPQTVILDIIYNGSDIYVDPEGDIKIHNESFDPGDVDLMATKIKEVKAYGKNPQRTS